MSEKKCGGCSRSKNKETEINIANVSRNTVSKGRVKKYILKNHQSPGDIMMLTAAVKAIVKHNPHLEIGVDTSCKELWDNNPYITKLDPSEAQVIKAEYPLINSSNTNPYHFIHGFAQFLESKLKVNIPIEEFKADIHLSNDEKRWMSQVREMDINDDFWLVFAGGKYDFSAKWWNPDWYQEVINHFQGKITFVQVGQKSHWHTPMKNCIDLTGQTNLRQLVRLVYHSSGVLSPVTFGMHAAAGVPTKPGNPQNRAAVVIAGSREPAQWEAYPHHRFLSNNGALPCSGEGGCWKSRCTLINDGDSKNTESVCEKPIPITVKGSYLKNKIMGELSIPKCMHMIEPRHVIEAIESYYIGGSLKYGSSIPDNIPDKAKKYITLGQS